MKDCISVHSAVYKLDTIVFSTGSLPCNLCLRILMPEAVLHFDFSDYNSDYFEIDNSYYEYLSFFSSVA